MVLSPALALTVFARNRRVQPPGPSLLDTVSWLGPPAVLAVIAFIPWWLDFTPESGGIYAYSGEGTRIEHVLLMWGVLIVSALALLPVAPARGRSFSSLSLGFLLPLLPLLVWLPLAAFERTAAPSAVADGLPTALAARTAGAWITLAVYGLALWSLAAATLNLNRRKHAAAPVLGLAAFGLLLLYLTELFLLRDALFGLPRLNTVFKLSYQAWLVLSLAGGVGAVAAIRAVPPAFRPLVVTPLGVLLGAALVFVVISVPNRAGGFEAMVGLDGLRYVERGDPGEYALVRWLRDNVERDAIVVESSGRRWSQDAEGRLVLREHASSYDSAAARVGSRTGLQTPIGWPGHELTWRGSSPELHAEIARRQNLVDLIYTASTPSEVLAALEALGASYIVVGPLERSHYPADLLPPFPDFLETAFSEGDVTVYRVPSYEDLR